MAVHQGHNVIDSFFLHSIQLPASPSVSILASSSVNFLFLTFFLFILFQLQPPGRSFQSLIPIL